jgi:hypothetical protein
LQKLKRLLQRGLEQTAAAWPELEVAADWLKKAVRILNNADERTSQQVKARYRALLAQMRKQAKSSPWLAQVVKQFIKVTRSYWPGLFHCYDVVDLPRTNNDLEQLFGSTRYHERRATGRKVARRSLVLRGAVQLPTVLATRLQSFTAADLVPRDLEQWRTVRAKLVPCHEAQVWGARFRRDPDKYLAALEEQALKLSLRF